MMLSTTLLALAGLATTSQAFLLPPSISQSDSDVVSTLPFEITAGNDGQVLDLDCSTCPFAQTSDTGRRIYAAVENRLQLNFSIEHGEKSERLLLNGMQLYPTPHRFMMPPLLEAPQLSEVTPLSGKADKVRLGYEFSMKQETGFNPEEDNLELIAMRFQVVEVDDIFVDGLDSVELKVIKAPGGKLMLANIHTGASANPSDAGGKDCTTLFCKWKAMLPERLTKGKPCPGKKAGAHGQPRIGGHPRPYHEGHRHHRNPTMAKVSRFVEMVFATFLVPVFVGIAVGMTVSLIGMIVGHLLVALWHVVYRRASKNAYTEIQQVDAEEEGAAKESMDSRGPPPVYEDVIVVEEKTEV